MRIGFKVEDIIEAVSWITLAGLLIGVMLRPLPVADGTAELCETAQENTYAAELQEATEIESAVAEITAEEPEMEATAEEPEMEAHCTDPASAWVEPVSLDYSGADAYLLAKIAYAEAGCEDLTGQALVIRVVLNRVWSDDFPDSIADVIFQEGQFSGVYSAAWDVIDLPDSAWAALELVESGWDESQGATYFCANGESEWHRDNLKELFTYGNHTFYIYEGGAK